MLDSTLRVIVADDERVSRQRLARLLRKEPGIEVVAECVGGKDAIKAIDELKPDVAFLDVRMPDMTGVDVALARPAMTTAIVFVTAYDDYATKAFELNAADYILKPVEAHRVKQTLERIRSRIPAPNDDSADIRRLLFNVSERLASLQEGSTVPPLERVAVRVAGVIRIFKTSDIDWIGTEGNYVALHVGTAKYLIRSTASDFEEQLDKRKFVRVHRQFIVNMDRVREVHPWFSGDAVIVMQTGVKVRLARTYRERFHAILGGANSLRDGDHVQAEA